MNFKPSWPLASLETLCKVALRQIPPSNLYIDSRIVYRTFEDTLSWDQKVVIDPETYERYLTSVELVWTRTPFS